MKYLRPLRLSVLLLLGLGAGVQAYAQSTQLRVPLTGLRVTSGSTGPSNPGGGPGDPPPPTPVGQLTFSPASIAFGGLATNTPEVRTIQVSNTGTAAVAFSGAPVVNGDPVFAISNNQCTGLLLPGTACSTEVTASSSQGASSTGTLQFSSDAPGAPHSVGLTASFSNPLSLLESGIPEGRLARAYGPFSMYTMLNVANEQTQPTSGVTWVLNNTLPPGLTWNASTGTLSGSPTQLTTGTGLPVELIATYKGNQVSRTYNLQVVEAVLDAKQLSAGDSVNCIVSPLNAVKCWGYSGAYQLGAGSNLTYSSIPVQTAGLTGGVNRVDLGGSHACAVMLDTTVKCWGGNGNAQLGLTVTGNQNTPTTVPDLTGVSRMALGTAHSCALWANGDVRCWGSNSSGQLGGLVDTVTRVAIGGSLTRANAMANTPILTGVSQLYAGANTTCAVLASGPLYCWGANNSGQIGDNSIANRNAPSQVTGVTGGVTSVDIGGNHTCAVINSQAYCWGANDANNKQVSLAGTTRYTTPTLVALAGTVDTVAAGGLHSCAIRTSGEAVCWGNNSIAQGGIGSKVNPIGPTAVLGMPEGATDIQTNAGSYHNCVRTKAGKVKCWGQGGNYALGGGVDTSDKTSATSVKD